MYEKEDFVRNPISPRYPPLASIKGENKGLQKEVIVPASNE